MLTDYKFWYIRRDDDGYITEAAIRFYEGEVVMDGAELTYRRTKRLSKADLAHFKDKAFIKEDSGKDARLYTQADFGRIKTDNELRLFLKGELLKDTDRSGIVRQIGEVLK